MGPEAKSPRLHGVGYLGLLATRQWVKRPSLFLEPSPAIGREENRGFMENTCGAYPLTLIRQMEWISLRGDNISLTLLSCADNFQIPSSFGGFSLPFLLLSLPTVQFTSRLNVSQSNVVFVILSISFEWLRRPNYFPYFSYSTYVYLKSYCLYKILEALIFIQNILFLKPT
jgi:hypothetical protein